MKNAKYTELVHYKKSLSVSHKYANVILNLLRSPQHKTDPLRPSFADVTIWCHASTPPHVFMVRC